MRERNAQTSVWVSFRVEDQRMIPYRPFERHLMLVSSSLSIILSLRDMSVLLAPVCWWERFFGSIQSHGISLAYVGNIYKCEYRSTFCLPLQYRIVHPISPLTRSVSFVSQDKNESKHI